MTDSTSAHFLQNELESNIKTLREETRKQKNKAKLFQGLSIVIGALITLALGVEVSEDHTQFQKNIALLLGVLLTVINGWNALFDYRKLWIRQKSTLLSLYQLRNELNYRLANTTQCSVDDLFESYLSIWEADSAEWTQIMRKDSKSPQDIKDENK